MFEIMSICKGGGYKYCRTKPKHPKENSKGLYPLHRVLMENKIKRLLKRGEVVHHKNENKDDNRLENLEILSISEHTRIHCSTVANVKIKCSWCQKQFELKPHRYRLRLKRNKSKKLFCSNKCGALYQYS